MTREECSHLALLYADLDAAGDPRAEAVLTALHGRSSAASSTTASASVPRTRSKMSPEELKEWNRVRRAEQRATKRLFSATVQCDSGATNGATTVRQIDGSRARSDSENSSLSGVVPAESESLEKSGRGELSCRTSATNRCDNGATGGATTQHDSTAQPETPHALWRQIFDQWVFIAHHGKSIGKPSQFSQSFTDIARMAEQRSPADPVGFAKDVIVRYVADRRKRGKDLSPRYFAADFGTFADSAPAQPGAAPVDPVVREMRDLNAKYAEAQARGDAVATATYEQKLKLLGKRILANAS
jgi:hypothetical protein